MEEHDAYEQELAYDIGEIKLALSSQRDSEDGQEDLSIGSVGGGGGGLSGIEIIWADQTETFIPSTDFFVDYDPATPTFDLYWSVVFAVSAGVMTQAAPTYDEVQEIYDDTGTAQTVYRLRLITQNLVPDPDVNVPISVYGQYREITSCINGETIQRLDKVT
jgi:hypothetical protein